MSGETADSESGWTVDTLRVHLQRQLDDQKDNVATALTAAEKAVDKALISAEKAVDKAEAAAKSKFSDQNEFRDQLKDQAARFVTRDEMNARFDSLTEKIGALEARMNLDTGRSVGYQNFYGWAISAVVALAAAVAIIIASR